MIMNFTQQKKLRKGLLLAFFIAFLPAVAQGALLTADTVWQGEVKVTEDILVPAGITLTIKPGTLVTVVAAESTKTEPEYVSPLTEITIRGTLKVEGSADAPVLFAGEVNKAGSWAGIIIDNGMAIMRNCRVRDAETAVTMLAGSLRATGIILQDNRYGLVAHGKGTTVVLESARITGNDYGLFALQGAQVQTGAALITGNRKKDSYIASARVYEQDLALGNSVEIPVSRRYQDVALRGETVWQGRIEINGLVRVPEGGRLVIMPGTVVEFLRKDSNGDGIGENGFLVQGRLIAKGTRENPIIFRSAEKNKRPGDWDAINIMNSASAQNLIEYCRIEHAYRALHFHFSNVALQNSVLTDNYRAVQFQESLVEIKGNRLCNNKSGIQGRDSDITLTDNLICNNKLGGNFYRANLVARGNRFIGNWKEGLRIREGVASLQENLIDSNRYGLMVADIFYGDYSHNVITNNMEIGVSLKNADNIDIAGNVMAANGLSGLTVQDVSGLIRGNLIADNGERGIGILSYGGVITENNFSSNGIYAIDLDGTGDVAAPANWWGGDDPGRVIFDKKTDPGKGKVNFEKSSNAPFSFSWPLNTIFTDTVWRGVIAVKGRVTVNPQVQLRIAPGTRVLFAPESGMTIKGKIIAKGKAGEEILFSSTTKTAAADWDELLLEYATDSEFAHCVFEYATWGIHSHFTNLSVSDCYFQHNSGGMRFRSGPVKITRSSFAANNIGIRAYIGNAVISENLITNNEIGIFIREKGGGLTITRNNIHANSGYNVRVSDFNFEDVNAAGNWWGSGDPLQSIFDGRNEPGIGKVLLDPYLTEPVNNGVRLKP